VAVVTGGVVRPRTNTPLANRASIYTNRASKNIAILVIAVGRAKLTTSLTAGTDYLRFRGATIALRGYVGPFALTNISFIVLFGWVGTPNPFCCSECFVH